MNFKFINRIRLYFNPPKKDDVYFGDSSSFNLRSHLETVWHGLTDIQGNRLWEPMAGSMTYKFTIESDVMPYYICKSEVLSRSSYGYNYTWRPRAHVRRIRKSVFNKMILDGVIVRQVEF